MKNDKNSNFYKQEVNLNMYMDTIHDTDNTELILITRKDKVYGWSK